ncbi:hypothetical protein GH714_020711 [Hevea brasiliensis]|uniref:CHCH domain-containing protein n=1 Tax=Hevea brasiliensis TaxID=3981 RepID=A0A6A6LJK6_HEVBR|nr:hypothetical protein GH714_020711 [Hevea brasiliensis]
MSAGGAFGGNRGLRPVPPEKGVFPLDHMHECDLEKKDYLNCLRSSSHQSEKCRDFSKKYLQCRMEKASSDSAEETIGDNSAAVAKADNNEMEFNREEVQSSAMAWNGKDVIEWHKRIAYQLNMKHADLVQWFRVVELPRIAGFFIPLLRKWSAEYAGRFRQIAWLLLDFLPSWEKTRLFLSRMNVKDLDELVKDLLNYLECGILFIYPELASISAYECFMEAVTEEIGWLDFYGTCCPLSNQERKRSKQHPIQAEKEIILSTVFTICYDVFSGFAHFSRSTQQPLDAKSLKFLLQSQSLLTVCLEDYRAVYARPCELPKIADAGASDRSLSVGLKGTEKLSVPMEAQQNPTELMLQGCIKVKSQQGIRLRKAGNFAVTEVITLMEASGISIKSSPLNESLLRRYSVKLASTSSDVCMGTQLLFVDIMDALGLVLKQLRGQKISRRQRRKLKRTLTDIATLIPITILMLIPVSAVGHAAMLAVIKNYMPSLIPSPYSSERLDVVKQLNRTKKMEVQSWSNLQDPSSIINLDDQSSNPVV